MPTTPAKAKARPKAEPKAKQSHPFYCPGCGRRWNYMTECSGMNANAPHAPIEVVSTDELNGEPEDRQSDAHRKWAEKLTPAPNTDVL